MRPSQVLRLSRRLRERELAEKASQEAVLRENFHREQAAAREQARTGWYPARYRDQDGAQVAVTKTKTRYHVARTGAFTRVDPKPVTKRERRLARAAAERQREDLDREKARRGV